jgi:4-amino-4-deoxy-L-arabinose transferase-like glycosyltransferase
MRNKNLLSIDSISLNNDPLRLVFLFLFAGFFIFFNLWRGSLYPWDEGWYGEIAKEIILGKNGWLTLHYNQDLFFDKPPLFIWLTAIAYKIFGINEFAVRFWSSLFGLGCIILVYFFTTALLRSKNLAFFSSLALLGYSHFYKQIRMGMMDVPLTFFIVLGIYLFWIGRRRQGFLFWIGPVIAMAFMIKSFAAFLLPIILIVYSFVAGEKRLLANARFIQGILFGVLICLPWHIYEYVKYGPSFINAYFFHHIVQRSLDTLKELPEQPFLYYFKNVLVSDFPLGIINIPVIPYFFFLAFKEKEAEEKAAFILIAISIATILTLFTIVKTKLPWYIIPVYPFLAIAVVISVGRIIDVQQKTVRQLLFALAFIVLLSVPIARIVFYPKYRTLDHRPELKEMSLLAREQSSRQGNTFFYNIHEETTALFYLDHEMTRVSRSLLLYSIATAKPFICLMSKEDGFFETIRRKPGISVLMEIGQYLLICNC